MPRTLAIDDYAAVLFEDEAPAVLYSWRTDASARYLERSPAGEIVEVPLDTPRVELVSS